MFIFSESPYQTKYSHSYIWSMHIRRSWVRIVRPAYHLGVTAYGTGICFFLAVLLSLLTGKVAFGGGAPAFVQEKHNQITSGQINSVSFTSPVAVGNLIVVYLIWDSTGSASVTDSLGNTYLNATAPTRWSSGRYSIQTFYTINRTSGTGKVTATFGTAVKSFGIVYANEYSGVNPSTPLDVTATASGTTGSLNSGLATITSDSALLFSGGVSAATVTGPGTGYTARSTFQGNITQDRMVNAQGSYNATASNSSGAWAIQLVAFRSAASGGGTLDTTAPTTPANLAVTATSANTVTLAWTASTDNIAVTGYKIYHGGVQVGTSNALSYTNSGLAASTLYAYSVSAYDAAGNNSAQSTSVSATTQAGLGGTSPITKPYVTNFSLTENPISEGGNWINGGTTGLDWTNCRMTPGLAFGTMDGNNPAPQLYADTTCVVAGFWGPNQTAQGTVRIVASDSTQFEEVEVRLRTTVSAHRITGYEVLCSVKPGNPYLQIVRWNGALGSFTMLDGRGVGCTNGDVLKGTISGSTISAYKNNVLIFSVNDATYSDGAPGMGFFIQTGNISTNANFGFTNFSATDGLSADTADTTPPSTPVNVSAVVGSSQVDLTWNPSTDNVAVTSYLVFRNNIQIASIANASFSDTTVSPGTQYSYSVAALDAAGNSSTRSSVVMATTTYVSDTTPPSVPANLQASNMSSTSLTLSWSPSTDNVGIAGYKVFRNGTQMGVTTSLNYADTGLTAATTYAYSVAAYDGASNVSAQSQQSSFTTPSIPLTSPVFVQVNQTQISNGAGTSVNFSSATRTGNTIVAYVIWDNTGAVALTDSQGNTFVNVGAPVSWGNGYSAQVFYAANIRGGSDTVTAAFRTAVTSFGVVYVHEYAGISPTNPVDVSTAASGSSSVLNSGNAITTSPHDLIFGAGVSDNVVTAAGSGFTSRDMVFGNITEERIAGAIGSYSATATHNGNMWAMQVVAFRPGQ